MKGRVGGQKKFRTDDDGTMDYSNYKLQVVHSVVWTPPRRQVTKTQDSRRKGPWTCAQPLCVGWYCGRKRNPQTRHHKSLSSFERIFQITTLWVYLVPNYVSCFSFFSMVLGSTENILRLLSLLLGTFTSAHLATSNVQEFSTRSGRIVAKEGQSHQPTNQSTIMSPTKCYEWHCK